MARFLAFDSLIVERVSPARPGLPSSYMLRENTTMRLTCKITWGGGFVAGYTPRILSAPIYRLVDGVWVDAGLVLPFYYVTETVEGTVVISQQFSEPFASILPGDGSYKAVFTFESSYPTPAFSATDEVEFQLHSYATPTIPAFSVNRCLADGTDDELGTRIEVKAQYAVSSIGELNTYSLKIYRKLVADSAWTFDKTLTPSGYSGEIGPIATDLTYASDARYDVKAEIVDLLSPPVTNIKGVLVGLSMGEVDATNRREAHMKRLESDSPSPGDDFGEPVMFRKPFILADIPGTLKALGLIAARANASPRGSMSANTFYLMKWTEVRNEDSDNLVPFTLAGDVGVIRGWKVKRAGWYRFSHILRWNSGSTAAASNVHTAVVAPANQASIADTMTEANISALSTYPLSRFTPASTAAVSESMTTECVYVVADAVFVVFAALSQTKTQETIAAYGRFSIERVA